MSDPLELSVASRCELGARKRNEDKVRVCCEGARWIAVVADGAGGHRDGAEASRRAVGPRQDNYSAVALWVRDPQQTTVLMTMPAR